MDPSPPHQVDMCEAPEGILLTSESHVLLFNHDEKIIGQSHKQLVAANRNITALEGRLHEVTEDYDFTLSQLHESEIARSNEAQSRIALQRHLHLELHVHSKHAQAYQSLELRYRQTMTDMDAMNTMNEMWRQEVERDQQVIDSMARKISEYESAAVQLSESWRELSRTSKPARYDATVESLAPDDESLPVLPTDSATANITAASPASDVTFIDESPQISATPWETSPSWRNLRWIHTRK